MWFGQFDLVGFGLLVRGAAAPILVFQPFRQRSGYLEYRFKYRLSKIFITATR
jgi:hypothetical protein